jgi:hypothetical protein
MMSSMIMMRRQKMRKTEEYIKAILPAIEKIIPSTVHCDYCDRDIEFNSIALALEIAKKIVSMGDT